MPCTSMIPMADTLNHSDIAITSEMVSKSMHQASDEDSSYFTKDKFMNDYSTLFAD